MPHGKKKSRASTRPGMFRRYSSRPHVPQQTPGTTAPPDKPLGEGAAVVTPPTEAALESAPRKQVRVGFAAPNPELEDEKEGGKPGSAPTSAPGSPQPATKEPSIEPSASASVSSGMPIRPDPVVEKTGSDSIRDAPDRREYFTERDSESQSIASSQRVAAEPQAYTTAMRAMPPKSFSQQLRPFNGRLSKDKWHKVAIRPLILLSYPAVLWSSIVYSCSVGWLIVISESVAVVFMEGHYYHFNALQTGLIYISPFIGGILGTAVAGKVSDIIVKAMARRNGGLYEPEFRLVMAIPVAISTVIGLMGFGWSAQVGDHWIVPTAFFGVVSFGCSLGSTTSITFCVDSYRQYAGEALVTLNFSKNIFHGLVFSLFVTGWLSADGPKTVYIWIGIIQLILLLATIPMYIYGKRARMWTVRKNFMERF